MLVGGWGSPEELAATAVLLRGGYQTEGSGVRQPTRSMLELHAASLRASNSLNNAQACLVGLDLREALN